MHVRGGLLNGPRSRPADFRGHVALGVEKAHVELVLFQHSGMGCATTKELEAGDRFFRFPVGGRELSQRCRKHAASLPSGQRSSFMATSIFVFGSRIRVSGLDLWPLWIVW